VQAVREAVARYRRASHDQLLLTTTAAMNETLYKLTESLQQQLEAEQKKSK